MKNLRYLRAFEWSGETFKDRVGEPDSLEAAVGKIAMNFADLDEVADRELRYLAELRLGHPVVDSAVVTFSQKIWRIGIFVAQLEGVLQFNSWAPANELFGELKHNCLQADALYRQVMTARWGRRCDRRCDNGAIEVERKDCLEGKESGLLLGAITADQLLDIADFIGLAEWDLEEFFIEPEEFTPEAA